MRRDDIKFGLKAAVDATKSDDYGEIYTFSLMEMVYFIILSNAV